MSNEKVLVLGVDGMDPVFTKYMVELGQMPNVKKFIERGSAREDLVMLGGVPTITPPMWTTLATGAYPNTHGITCFWNQHPEELDTLTFALDSRECKAEQVWNVLAENGKKTLVWHWPGGSWPPSSDSPNLHVVEGATTSSMHNGCAALDADTVVYADIKYTAVGHKDAVTNDSGAGCILTDVHFGPTDLEEETTLEISSKTTNHLLFSHADGEATCETMEMLERYQSPLSEPKNWMNAPEDAKEFTILGLKGTKRYPALLLKNTAGEYRKVAVYKNKKVPTPLVVLDDEGEYIKYFEDEFIVDGEPKRASRFASILEIDPKGESVVVWFSIPMNIDVEPELWSPKHLYKDVIDNVGTIPPGPSVAGVVPYLLERRFLPAWDYYQEWQGKAMRYLMEQEGYEMVFSHLHNVDMAGHVFWRYAKHREEYQNDEVVYQDFMREVYRQTDKYLGGFLPLLDEGWSIIITSDHGLICGEEDEIPLIGEGFGTNIGVMKELGYTVLLKDENGNERRKIDWSKTKAVAPRGNHIYINLKGRNPYGIVEPEDKYELEREIIDALYNYRQDGKRIINLAIRNKDAALLGLGGPGCGDIIYFVEEGFNRMHGDSLSTTTGLFHTSVSPIFIAAGNGIKAGYTTDRVIREVDVAPTVAALAGVRMPAQCEGAPVYQILEK